MQRQSSFLRFSLSSVVAYFQQNQNLTDITNIYVTSLKTKHE
jgi:hypothetical protein